MAGTEWTFEEIMRVSAKYGEMDKNKDIARFAREIIAMDRQRSAELRQQHDAALRVIDQLRMTLRWVAEDLKAGEMDPKTLAAARSDLASYLGTISSERP